MILISRNRVEILGKFEEDILREFEKLSQSEQNAIRYYLDIYIYNGFYYLILFRTEESRQLEQQQLALQSSFKEKEPERDYE